MLQIGEPDEWNVPANLPRCGLHQHDDQPSTTTKANTAKAKTTKAMMITAAKDPMNSTER